MRFLIAPYTKKFSLSLIAIAIGLTTYAQVPQQHQPMQQQQQQEVSVGDEELKKFAQAASKMQELNQSLQGDMVQVLEEEGVSVEAYKQFIQSQRNPELEDEQTEEKKNKLKAANQKILKLQSKGEEKMKAEIIEQGLTVSRYQEIAALVQQNPQLQQKLQNYMGN